MEEKYFPVVTTIAWYGAIGRPLTLLEVCDFMIPPERFGLAGKPFDNAQGKPSPAETLDILDRLVADNIVTSSCGFYSIAGEHDVVGSGHIAQELETAKKWRKFRKASRWLALVPFVRLVAASGSLAIGTSKPQSDWDVFVVAEKNRIFITRTGLLFVAWLMRRLRTKRDNIAPDCFCFNHIVTTDGLSLVHKSIFTAHTALRLIPVIDVGGYFRLLLQKNNWMDEYATKTAPKKYVLRTICPGFILWLTRNIIEFLLSSFFGDIIERLLMRWQVARIRKNPKTHSPGGRIVAHGKEIEFHPQSFEYIALGKYNAVLERLGMGKFLERDSGIFNPY